MELNIQLFNMLPIEIIINEIIPFTHKPQPNRHTNDIRSFFVDMNLIENMFYAHNDIIVLNDLIRFCNSFISPVYDISDKYELILRRHFSLKNKTNDELWHFVFFIFHRNLLENTSRKIRFLFGLLTPIERTRFFNHFYIDDE
jgi:hypothetical protein